MGDLLCFTSLFASMFHFRILEINSVYCESSFISATWAEHSLAIILSPMLPLFPSMPSVCYFAAHWAALIELLHEDAAHWGVAEAFLIYYYNFASQSGKWWLSNHNLDLKLLQAVVSSIGCALNHIYGENALSCAVSFPLQQTADYLFVRYVKL